MFMLVGSVQSSVAKFSKLSDFSVLIFGCMFDSVYLSCTETKIGFQKKIITPINSNAMAG